MAPRIQLQKADCCSFCNGLLLTKGFLISLIGVKFNPSTMRKQPSESPRLDKTRLMKPAMPGIVFYFLKEIIMSTGIVKIHRVLRANPEKVYRAFTDADAMAKWLPPFGFTCAVHHFDAKVGGTFRMSFKNFSTGTAHSFGGEYLELKPFELIRYNDKFDDPNLPGVMLVTVSLKAVLCGTELNVTQENIPEVIPLEMCYLGWQESLVQLANLVEPEIPG